jgi:hypothetical protein
VLARLSGLPVRAVHLCLPHFGAIRIVARKFLAFLELSSPKLARYWVEEVMKKQFAALTCTLIGDAYLWFAFLLL